MAFWAQMTLLFLTCFLLLSLTDYGYLLYKNIIVYLQKTVEALNGNLSAQLICGLSYGQQCVNGKHDYDKAFMSTLYTPKQMSYSLTEDIVESKLYYRTLPSIKYTTDALVALLDTFKWYKVGTIASMKNVEQYQSFVAAFSDYLKEKTNGVIHLAYSECYVNQDQLSHSLYHLLAEDIKIIVAFMRDVEVPNVLCNASRAGLMTSDHVWILPSHFDPDLWQKYPSNCSQEELKSALESTLFIAPTKYPPFTQNDLAFSAERFREDLLNKTQTLFPSLATSDLSHLLTHSNAISAYDAVWTTARAWHSILNGSDCENSADVVTKGLEYILAEISDLEFKHMWDKEGCTIVDDILAEEDSQNYYGQVVIIQFQGGYLCPVGLVLPISSEGERFVRLDDINDHSCPRVVQLGEWIRNFSDFSANCSFDFRWKDGKTSAPTSGYSVEYSEIDLTVFAVTCIVTVVIIALLISIAVCNLMHRKNKFFKASSPRMSIAIIFSFLLLVSRPVFIGLVSSADAYDLSVATVDVLCWCIQWLPSFGFPLIHSTLFAKNYRIYRIFHNKKLKVKQGYRLSDGTLMTIVLLSLVPVAVMCITSAGVERISHFKALIPLNEEVDSFQFVDVTYCSKPNQYILVAIMVYIKAIAVTTLVFAVFNMKLSSRFGAEGRAASAVVIIFFLVCWIYFLTGHHVDHSAYIFNFFLEAVYTFGTILLMMGCLFIPLYYHMYKDHQQNSSLTESLEDSQRLEHYHHLHSQAAELRKQLDEIEMKLKKLRMKSE